MGRGKAEWMRNLRVWDIRQYYEWNHTNNWPDYDKPYYVFRPNGFDTKLLTLTKPDSISTGDFVKLMESIRLLAGTPEPAPRNRKRK